MIARGLQLAAVATLLGLAGAPPAAAAGAARSWRGGDPQIGAQEIGAAQIGAQEQEAEELAAALARLPEAPGAAQAALDALARRAPELLLAALAEEPSAGSDGLPHGPRAAALAVALAGSTPAALEALLAPPRLGTAELRRAGLAVLAERDGPADLELALGVADEGDEAGALGPALRTVATRLHARSDAVGAALPDAVRRAPLALSEPLVRALADVDRPETVVRLAGLLGAVEPCDPLLLALLARRAAGDPAALDPRVVEAVRGRLRADEASARREAVNAAAQLRDYGAVEELIRLLSDEHPGVRDNALRGLEQLSALRLGPLPDRWRVWHALNRRWWVEDWPLLKLELLTGDHETVVEALRSVAGRRYRHDEIAAVVVRVLERTDDPPLLRFACLTLAALGSPATARALVPLLDDPDGSVRAAAHDALRRLTDLDLPDDADAWSAALTLDRAG